MMKSVRIAIAVCALVLGVAAYVSAVPDTKAVAGPYVCTYYKDGTYRKAVGGTALGCCGQVTSWGQTTVYVRCQSVLCPDVVCPD